MQRKVPAFLRLFPPSSAYPTRDKVVEVWRRLAPLQAAQALDAAGGLGRDNHCGSSVGNDDVSANTPRLSKSLTLAALYMLHVERWHPADVPLRRDGGSGSGSGSGSSAAHSPAVVVVPGILAARHRVLRRYTKWVDCACGSRDNSCTRRWNFANDIRLERQDRAARRRPWRLDDDALAGTAVGGGNAEAEADDDDDDDDDGDNDDNSENIGGDIGSDADFDTDDDDDDDDDGRGSFADSSAVDMRRGWGDGGDGGGVALCRVAAYARRIAGRRVPAPRRRTRFWATLINLTGRREKKEMKAYARTARRWLE